MNVAVEKQLLPGLNLPDNISPDKYEFREGNYVQPTDDFIISRNNQGSVISFYKDPIWDFTPYITNVKAQKKFNFLKNIPNDLISEAKSLLFLVLLFKKGRKGSSLSTTTLNSYFSTIKRLSKFSSQYEQKISEVLSNSVLLERFASLLGKYKDVRLLYLLDKIGNCQSMIDFKIDKKIIRIFLSKKKKYNQTLVIPSSILNESIKQRWHQFNEIYDSSKLLFDFLELHIKSNLNIRDSENKHYINKRFFIGKWKPLGIIFKKYGVQKQLNIGHFINQLQSTCRHLIIAYSGMRASESLSLNVNSCKEINGSFFLTGKTSKLEGRNKEVNWVTSKKIERVVDFLSSISMILGSKHDIELNNLPLFISPLLLYYKKNEIKKGIVSHFTKDISLPLDTNNLTIKNDDISELEAIDSFNRFEDTSEVKIGNIWKFKLHQYRRSLCVYALQSGLVSIGSLQFQFKHLFREMTLYYGNGASRAKELFSVPQNHIAMNFDDVKLEMDTLSYIKNVLFSEEELFGSYGKLVDNIGSPDLNKLTILELRKKTLNKFKNGEIVYKETALGGCISEELCNNRLTRSIYACADCDGAILKKSKIERVIEKQESFLSYLDKNSIEYRTELDDLNILKKRKDKLLNKDSNE